MNIEAYGVGKVNVEKEHRCKYDHTDSEEENIGKNVTQEARMFEKIKNFNKHLDNISHSLCSMA